MSKSTANRSRRKTLLRVAWPLIINSGSFALLNFADRLFLSWHSEAAFRASLPGGILFFTLVCGFMALAGITNTFVSQLWGSGDRIGCARATSQGIWLALLSTPLIVLLAPIGISLLRLSGHESEVLMLEEQYFKILLFGGGGMVLSSALSAFFSGRGRTRVVMSCNIIANVVNIILNYMFVFGQLGLPEMGIIGAAWGSVISSWICPLLFAALYFSPKNRCDFDTLGQLRFDKPLFTRMLRFGGPSGVHFFTEVAAFSVFVLMIGRLGPVAHVASNIALSINLIAFMPMIGMGIAASILVGQYLGRDNSKEAERMGWFALRIGMGYIGIVGITFIIFPDIYLRLFTAENANVCAVALSDAVQKLLIMVAIWGLADAASLILSGALKGAGDTHFVMRYQAWAAWGFLVPGQIVIVAILEAHYLISWAWTLLYIIILGGGFTIRFASGRWKEIKLIDRHSVSTPLGPGADTVKKI